MPIIQGFVSAPSGVVYEGDVVSKATTGHVPSDSNDRVQASIDNRDGPGVDSGCACRYPSRNKTWRNLRKKDRAETQERRDHIIATTSIVARMNKVG